MVKRFAALPLIFTMAFVSTWTFWKLAVAAAHPLPSWDGMVYWINGENFLQGRYPVYEFFRPPLLPFFLALTQMVGLSLQTAYLWHPLATGLSGIVLFLLLRNFVREWLASAGIVIYLTTSVVQYWSTTILTHGFTMLFLITGLYFLIQPSFRSGIVGAAFLSLAVFTRYPVGLIVLPIGLWFALKRRRIIDIDKIVIGSFAPLVPILLAYPQGLFVTFSQIYQAEVLGNKSVFVGGSALPQSVPPTIYIDWILGNLQFLAIFLGIGLVVAARSTSARTLVFWFVPYLVIFSLIANRQDRFIFELAPAFAALVVIGFENVLRRFKNVRLLPLFILLLVGIYAVNQTLVGLPQQQAEWGSGVPSQGPLVTTLQLVGREIQSHSQPLDVVLAEDKVPWLSYYSSRFVYLARLEQVASGTVLENYMMSFNPHPTLVVAVPSFGSNVTFVKAQPYLSLIEVIDTPAWGQVYLFQVTLP
jgi:4-amino-4-deoxy-L-arabinose transferase-like glycosyltransferase